VPIQDDSCCRPVSGDRLSDTGDERRRGFD